MIDARVERVLPGGWDTKTLGEVGDFGSGSGFPIALQGNLAGEYGFLKVSDMNLRGNERYITTANNRVDDSVRRRLGARAFPRGTIIFAKVGAAVFLERRRLLREPSCLDNNMAGFSPNEQLADSLFIFYWLQHFRLSDLVATTALPSINNRQLKAIQIALPPLREQRSIAEALSDTDLLLESQDALIEKKRHIRQGAMWALLRGTVRLPGFAEPWTRLSVGELVKVRHGRSQHAVEDPNGPVPIYATGGQIGWAREALHPGPSALIGRKGTIDRPRYSEGPFWTVDTLFYTETVRGTVAKFVYFLFETIDWYRFNEASGVPSLNATTIESIEVLAPDPSEQAAIAEVLSDMDAEIEALVAQRAKTELIKQGMMSELLTGRTTLT